MKIHVGFLLFCAFVVGTHGAAVESTSGSTPKTTEPSTSSETPAPTTVSSSTTHVPTTHTPPTTSSTSEVPTTTEVVTTKEPEPTTTTTPSEAPTTMSTTTVSPTESPTPAVGNWTVSNAEGNVTCIHAKMGVKMIVKNLGLHNNETISHNLSPDASSAQSQCNYEGKETEQSLVLQDGDYTLTFIFAQDKVSFYVQNISLSFTEGKEDERTTSGKYFAANRDSSYRCSKQDDVVFKNVTLKFSDLQIQAFGSDNSTNFRKTQECDADEKMNDIVPIAVAAVLCGMVVIILIGYLIGRRQTRPRGYQSM